MGLFLFLFSFGGVGHISQDYISTLAGGGRGGTDGSPAGDTAVLKWRGGLPVVQLLVDLPLLLPSVPQWMGSFSLLACSLSVVSRWVCISLGKSPAMCRAAEPKASLGGAVNGPQL